MRYPLWSFPVRWALPAVYCLSLLLARAEPNSVEEIETVRASLSRSLELRDQAAGEQFAWDLRRGQLENLILVGQEEKRNLEAVISVARPMLEDLHAQRLGLSSDREESKVLEDILREAGPRLGGKLLDRSRRWPDPLVSATMEPLYRIRSILELDVAALSGQDLDTLIRSIVEALEEALKFQSRIHHASVLKRLPDGREAMFDTIYLGLGGGFYRSVELDVAGRIIPQGDGWEWVPQADLLEPVGRFLETLNGERPATWIDLPIRMETEEASR